MAKTQNELIETIGHIKTNTSQFKNYIDYIRFPHFKNLAKDTKISFDFPFTVFVGKNGCGKSSALQALYGCPKGYSPATFWFSTDLDPIKESERRNCIIYAYNNIAAQDVIEVLKTRIKYDKEKQIYDYWEPSRAIKEYGMVPPPPLSDGQSVPNGRSKTRWDQIEKKVLYIDFRNEISAFDKYFYFGQAPKTLTMKTKQDYIRRYSPYLRRVLVGGHKVTYRGREKHKDLYTLSDNEVENSAFILGKSYNQIRMIEHSFYKNSGKSILYDSRFGRYSEAFAGSGEIAIISLVAQVGAVEDYSLVLLDEPETSLHPGAQHKLKQFLLEQILRKKLQVVICSHSPSLIKGLPENAIKVFYENEYGMASVKENVIPEEAFFYLGYEDINKTTIIVEDYAAKLLIEKLLKDYGSETESIFNVEYYPGGAAELKQSITIYSRSNNARPFIILDGDQKYVDCHIDPNSIPVSEYHNLSSLIFQQCQENIKFAPDGHEGEPNQDQKNELMLSFLRFYHENVYYLPTKTPEELIWRCSTITESKLVDNGEYKEAIAALSNELFGENKRSEIEHTLKYLVQQLDMQKSLLQETVGILNKFRRLQSH